MNTQNLDIAEIYGSNEFSYVLPKQAKDGALYFIERPIKQKLKKKNILWEILTIPFKLVMAIYYFLETFTMLFTGKTFTSKKTGDTVAKNGKNKAEVFIDGNKQNAEDTLEENKKLKEKFPGYAPHSFRLVKLASDNSLVEIKKGVLNFDIDENGIIYYTNGKYILKIEDGKEEEVCKTSISQVLAYGW